MPLGGGGPLSMVGDGAGRTIVMLNGCGNAGAVPLLAVTMPVNVPAVVGAPLMTPAGLKVSPGGGVPVVTLNVGEPVDV